MLPPVHVQKRRSGTPEAASTRARKWWPISSPLRRSKSPPKLLVPPVRQMPAHKSLCVAGSAERRASRTSPLSPAEAVVPAAPYAAACAAAAAGAAPPVKGKYRVVVVDHGARAATAAAGASAKPRWQYWVDDGVDGKAVGWYDYDDAGAAVTEALYVEWGLNAWLTERVVASGAWTYLVDLAAMCQTNLEHYAHTRRRVRRVPPGGVPDGKPPV
eukprot:TRINITY_DN3040_c0_g1_i2.p2 TRINITY_DN3040_c0_g1~~TRINITY_DN3040_c0_g1_i2.p2  ORF type:complete len:215 (-),score=52.05 TRINITY_DN3040_c0_g1_i2:48-692(-)